jgi:hypothetical protein
VTARARLMLVPLLTLLLGATSSFAQLPDLLKRLPHVPSSGEGLGDARISQGLKDLSSSAA